MTDVMHPGEGSNTLEDFLSLLDPTKREEEELKRKWQELWLARIKAGPGSSENRKLAASEHAAFVERIVREKPHMAVPMLFGIPAYNAGKALGFVGSDTASPPTLEGMAASYDAWWRAVRANRRKYFHKYLK